MFMETPNVHRISIPKMATDMHCMIHSISYCCEKVLGSMQLAAGGGVREALPGVVWKLHATCSTITSLSTDCL